METRKQKLLNHIIRAHIKTAGPVGSGLITKKYMKDVSSPTVRNEMQELEKQGLIKSRWDISNQGRKRKYYQINKQGTKILKSQKAQWDVVYSALNQLWENKPCLT